MSQAEQTCPRCGRRMPASHTLCIKCGARLGEAAPVAKTHTMGRIDRRVLIIAAAVGLGVIAVVVILAVVLSGDDAPPKRPPAEAEIPPPLDAAHRPATEGPSPPPLPRPAVPRPPDAGQAPLPGPPGPMGGPPGPGQRPPLPLRGFIAEIRDCVDQRRKTSEIDCEVYRQYLGYTAESFCLIAKVVETYFVCLKSKAKGVGKCLRRCAVAGQACAHDCARKDRRPPGTDVSTCLLTCWSRAIDPCLGACTRP